jgi:hypothetical protein
VFKINPLVSIIEFVVETSSYTNYSSSHKNIIPCVGAELLRSC